MARFPLIFLSSLLLTVACSDQHKPPKEQTGGGASADDDQSSDDDATGDDDDGDDDVSAPSTMKDGGTGGMMDARVATRDASVDAGKDAAKDATSPTPRDASGPSNVDAAVTMTVDAGGTDSGRIPGTPGAAKASTVTVGGAPRTFQLYIPSGLDKSVPVPLVSVHHGFTMSGKIMEQITTWKAVAEREGIVVAFADGGDGAGPWNVGAGVCSPGDIVSAPDTQDDFGFVKAIIEFANTDQAIDKSRVFVGGFSMGGFFANNVGCKAREWVRAIAAHSSGTYPGTCPGKPVPVLMIHGDADGLIDYTSCGRAAFNYWVERNGCGTAVDTESIKEGTCAWNKDCPVGQELGFCTMKGMNHGWAGADGNGDFLGAVLYPVTMDATVFGGGAKYENAAELMWKFFKRYL